MVNIWLLYDIIWLKVVNNALVGGFNHVETYEFVNGKQDIPYIKWTIMFETTNQIGK